MELQPWGFIPLFLHVVPTQEPECTTTSQACEGHDDELHAVLEGCDTKWQRVEDGLWLRSTPLPLLYDCFIESDDGNYRRFGEDDEDFVKILSDVGKSIAVALADSMTMRVFRPGQPVEILALKPGLRYLRCLSRPDGPAHTRWACQLAWCGVAQGQWQAAACRCGIPNHDINCTEYGGLHT